MRGTSRGTLFSAAMCGRNEPGPSAKAWSTTAAGPRISCESALRRCSTPTLPLSASFSARPSSWSIARREVREARAGLRELRELRLGLGGDVRRIGAGLLEDLGDAAIAIERAGEQVDGLDLDVLALVGEGLRAGDERLGVGGVSLEMNRLLGGHGEGERTTVPASHLLCGARARPHDFEGEAVERSFGALLVTSVERAAFRVLKASVPRLQQNAVVHWSQALEAVTTGETQFRHPSRRRSHRPFQAPRSRKGRAIVSSTSRSLRPSEGRRMRRFAALAARGSRLARVVLWRRRTVSRREPLPHAGVARSGLRFVVASIRPGRRHDAERATPRKTAPVARLITTT